MKIIITSGSTYTPIDDIRGITNLSKGTTGAKLAEEALLRGYNVDYISNKYTKKPFEKTISPLSSETEILKLLEHKTLYQNNFNFIEANYFDNYIDKCSNLNISKNEKTVFISCAAVSDYTLLKSEGKISSKNDSLDLILHKTPKIIQEVKKQNPLLPVIGFKLLSSKTSSVSDLIDIAYQSLLKSRMSMIVANLVDENFKILNTFVITPEKHITPVKDRNDLPNVLFNLIEDRLNQDFYSTTIESEFPSSIDISPFKKLLNDCSNYSLFTPYGEGRKEADFGALAMRTEQGIVTTGRGTTKKEVSEDNLTVVTNISNNNIQILSNKVKATLNASTLWYILQEREDINYIVHSHVYLANGVFIENEASPSTYNDYQIIEKAIKEGNNVINQVGHGCFILLKHENELLDILKKQGLYNSKYAKYYDMAYYRFKKGILEKTIEDLNLNKNSKVLDLACGTGKSSLELINMGFNNLDLADDSIDMLNIAKGRTNKKGVQASFNSLSNIQKTYDLITIRQAFSYIDINDIEYFAKTIYQKLNNEGLLVFNGFKVLDSGIKVREDYIEEESLILKTKESNIIDSEKVIHSQRTEYLNVESAEYIPLYDLNIFNQYDFNEISSIFKKVGFDVNIVESNKSVCFVGRKKL